MATEKEVQFVYEIIDEYNLSGEDVANLFLNWNGTQLITAEFIEYIKEEYNLSGEDVEE